MKKILLYLITLAISVPVFASCSIDSKKPCMADNIISKPSVRTEPNPLNKNSERKSQYIQKNDIPSYDASCQFGICLPNKNPAKKP